MLRQAVIFSICACFAALLPTLFHAAPEANLPQPPVREEKAAATAQTVAPSLQTMRLAGRKELVAADGAGHFVADFKLNGRAVRAMIDTGATVVAVNRSTAQSIGYRLAPADFRIEVQTANGTARAASIVLDNVGIGRLSVDRVAAVVLDDELLGETLVGMSFLSRLKGFQVADGALILNQ